MVLSVRRASTVAFLRALPSSCGVLHGGRDTALGRGVGWRAVTPDKETTVYSYPFVLRIAGWDFDPMLRRPQASTIEDFVRRFGTCGPTWRSDYVASAQQLKTFEAFRVAKTIAAAEKAAVDVDQYLYQVQTCYLRALEVPSWSQSKGRLKLRIAVAAHGGVVAARATGSDTLAGELACCVQNAALEWRFPRNDAFRVVERTFSMEAQGTSARVRMGR